MARVDPRDGKYRLGGPRNADLEKINDKDYDVFTEDVKLAEARQRYPNYTWFVSYTIQTKSGEPVPELPEYMLLFDKPDVDSFQLYYYLNGNVHPLPYEMTNNEGNRRRVRAKLHVGDPPIGSVP